MKLVAPKGAVGFFLEESTRNIHASVVSKNSHNWRNMDTLRLCEILDPLRVARKNKYIFSCSETPKDLYQ